MSFTDASTGVVTKTSPKIIVKRDGREETWSVDRVAKAILKSLQASGIKDPLLAKRLAKKVEDRLVADKVEQELVQDTVEQVLMESRLYPVAKKYILYRDKRRAVRAGHEMYLDIADTIDSYLDKSDWRVAENSNMAHSFQGLMLHMSGAVQARYALEKYPEEIRNAHNHGYFHIHDLSFGLAGYCFTGDTKVRLLDGTAPTLKELAETKANETFWVYSRDKNNNIVAGRAHHPRLTRKNAELVVVEISGGEYIKCTPDHQFMMRDGSYKEAKDLRKGDSLMPLYVNRSGNYLRVQDSKLKIEEYIHRQIAKYYYEFDSLEGYVVHHLNGDKYDNRPENLEIMKDSDHRAMELAKTKETDLWKTTNKERLVNFNKSDSKRAQVSAFAQQRPRDERGCFYNHVVMRKPIRIPNEDVYCLTVDEYENFALDAGVFVHNCAGWSLRDLLMEGFNLEGRCSSGPAKHFDAALGQIVNFLGTLQNEWAGAQAYNNFDTYLAPFVRKDNLSYEQVKQDIQKFIYNLNTTSRWGGQCLIEGTTCLTPNGWKDYKDLNVGDTIYVFDTKTQKITTDTLTRVYVNDAYKGKMYHLKGDKTSQVVTEKHRVVFSNNETINYEILPVEKVVEINGSVFVPSLIEDNLKDITSDLIKEKKVFEYEGTVWCPTTNTGTLIARYDNTVFITGNSPFTNLTFDMSCPKHIANEPVIIGGKLTDDVYGDFNKEMEMINKAFLEVMLEGDYNGRIFSFPIPTYNVSTDFPWDTEVGELLLKLTAKYGVPYFQNFINSDLNPEDVRSMCCRLQMDLRELKKRTGGLFGAGDLTGSVGVVTLNLPKLAYLAQSEEDFLDLITEYATLAKDSLEFKRKMVVNNFENNMFPFSKRYLKNGFRGHFSTIGLVGGHEACLNILGKGIETESGTRLMIRVLNHLRDLVTGFQEETGNLYNLEATPAEGTSYRLAKIDKKLYEDIITSGTPDVPYYTNSTLLPVGFTTDIFKALEHQNQLQTLYTGGTVFHSFLGEAIPDTESLKTFILKALSQTKMPYISITPTFSVCKEHGYLTGEQLKCPTCGAETEVYSRVVGYYRPVKLWNKGKQVEYKDRTEYSHASALKK